MDRTSRARPAPSNALQPAASAAKPAAANKVGSEEEQKLMRQVEILFGLYERYIAQGRGEQDENRKIDHFNEAKKWNNQASELLDKLPRQIESRQESSRKGAEIADCLMCVQVRLADRETEDENRISYLKAAIGHAQEIEAHASKCESPAILKSMCRKMQAKASCAILLSSILFSLAEKKGDEKIDFLNSAVWYSRLAVDTLKPLSRFVTITEQDLEQILNEYWSLLDDADDAIRSFFQRQLSHPGEAAGLSGPDKNNLGEHFARLARYEDMEDAYSSMLKDFHAFCETFLKNAGEARHAWYKAPICAAYKEEASRRIMIQSFKRYGNDLESMSLMLAHHALNSGSLAGKIITILLDRQIKKCLLAMGSMDLRLRDMAAPQDEGSIVPQAQQCEALLGLISRCDELEEGVKWIVDIGKRCGMSDEGADQIGTLAKSAACIRDAAKFRMQELRAKAVPKAQSPSSQKQRMPLRPAGEPQSSGGKQNSSKAGKAAAAAKQEMKFQVIDTLADGKLIGTRVGELVVVTDFNGQKITYQQDADKWVRQEDESMDFNAMDAASQDVQGAADEKAGKAARLAAIARQVEKAVGQIDKLINKAAEYRELSDFADTHDAPASQSMGIFHLALDSQRRALALASKMIARLERQADEPEIAGHRQRMEKLLGTVENETRAMRERMLAFAKERHSVAGLNFLLDERQVTKVEKTLNKKQCRALDVSDKGVTLPDFLDEYKVHIAESRPYTIHVHYRKKDPHQALEDSEAIHIKDAGAKQERMAIPHDPLQYIDNRSRQ